MQFIITGYLSEVTMVLSSIIYCSQIKRLTSLNLLPICGIFELCNTHVGIITNLCICFAYVVIRWCVLICIRIIFFKSFNKPKSWHVNWFSLCEWLVSVGTFLLNRWVGLPILNIIFIFTKGQSIRSTYWKERIIIFQHLEVFL